MPKIVEDGTGETRWAEGSAGPPGQNAGKLWSAGRLEPALSKIVINYSSNPTLDRFSVPRVSSTRSTHKIEKSFPGWRLGYSESAEFGLGCRSALSWANRGPETGCACEPPRRTGSLGVRYRRLSFLYAYGRGWPACRKFLQ